MKREYANLDLLRATAVLIVFISHLVMVFGYLNDPALRAWGITQLAEFGVLLFFIHTSLVLMMSLHRLAGGHVVAQFYIRRIFRIYPLAVLTVCVALFFRIPPHFEASYPIPSTATIWSNLLLVQNLFNRPDIVGPMWSLPLEVQMYVFLPLLYVAARRIRSYPGALAMMACGFALWYADAHAARAIGYSPLFQYAPWFFMGSAAYGLFQFVTPRLGSRMYVACLALLIATPCVTHRVMGDDYHGGWVVWAAGIAFSLALPHFGELRSARVSRCAQVIATYSYGIYLSHVPIMWFAFQRLSGTGWLVQVSTFAVLMGAVPVLLYHGLERPLIRVGAAFADALRSSRGAPGPTFSLASLGPK